MKKNKSIVSYDNILFCIILIILIGIIQTVIFNNVKSSEFLTLLTIKQDDESALINTIWQVQAGVTTLTIAILALIVGLNKEKKFGIKVLKYVLITKPKFLMYHDVIILSIILLFISYFFVAFEALSAVVFIFFIGIILIINMVFTSIKMVLFEEKVESEIKNYILEKCMKEIEIENKDFTEKEVL